jgi:hypothetical protein
VACDISWTVHDDLCDSDHFITLTEDIIPTNKNQNQNWNFCKANWNEFDKVYNETINEDELIDENYPILKFTNIILENSEKCIPKTSTNKKTGCVYETQMPPRVTNSIESHVYIKAFEK